jgi:riboflavin synthase
MFTGQVSTIGRITLLAEVQKHVHVTCMAAFNPEHLIPHNHIMCEGVALPIIERGTATGEDAKEKRSWFTVEVASTLLERTLIGGWKKDKRLNLELPLTYGSQITGHLVNGRPDARVKLVDLQKIGDTYQLFFAAPKKLLPFLVEQGNITLNGVALGIYQVNEVFFSSYVIPTHWEFTTLSSLQIGDLVHAEVDTLARYAAKLVKSGQTGKLVKSS